MLTKFTVFLSSIGQRKTVNLYARLRKEPSFFCSSQHSAEVVKWQNEDCNGLKSSSKGMAGRKNNDRFRKGVVFGPVTIVS